MSEFTMPEDRDYWDAAMPTYMENWPQALRDMSIPFVSAPMTETQMVCLGSIITESFEYFEEWFDKLIPSLRPRPAREAYVLDFFTKLHDQLGVSPFFVRLGSRSPKDSLYAEKCRYQCEFPLSAVEIMAESMDRIKDDLLCALGKDYSAHLVFRPWIDIRRGSEARCFVRNGVCVGVSEYKIRHAKREHKALAHDDIVQAYQGYSKLAEEAAKAADIPDLIVDVCLQRTPGGWSPIVIEVNPFFNMADPMLFSWKSPEEFKPGAMKFMSLE